MPAVTDYPVQPQRLTEGLTEQQLSAVGLSLVDVPNNPKLESALKQLIAADLKIKELNLGNTRFDEMQKAMYWGDGLGTPDSDGDFGSIFRKGDLVKELSGCTTRFVQYFVSRVTAVVETLGKIPPLFWNGYGSIKPFEVVLGSGSQSAETYTPLTLPANQDSMDESNYQLYTSAVFTMLHTLTNHQKKEDIESVFSVLIKQGGMNMGALAQALAKLASRSGSDLTRGLTSDSERILFSLVTGSDESEASIFDMIARNNSKYYWQRLYKGANEAEKNNILDFIRGVLMCITLDSSSAFPRVLAQIVAQEYGDFIVEHFKEDAQAYPFYKKVAEIVNYLELNDASEADKATLSRIKSQTKLMNHIKSK